jgi:hypothetical protein
MTGTDYGWPKIAGKFDFIRLCDRIDMPRDDPVKNGFFRLLVEGGKINWKERRIRKLQPRVVLHRTQERARVLQEYRQHIVAFRCNPFQRKKPLRRRYFRQRR